jgi:hypothetical protein
LTSGKPLKSISNGPSPISIKVGQKIKIPVIFDPVDTSDHELIYSVSAAYQSIISVDASGVITVLSPGTGLVWIQSKNNVFIFNNFAITVDS